MLIIWSSSSTGVCWFCLFTICFPNIAVYTCNSLHFFFQIARSSIILPIMLTVDGINCAFSLPLDEDRVPLMLQVLAIDLLSSPTWTSSK